MHNECLREQTITTCAEEACIHKEPYTVFNTNIDLITLNVEQITRFRRSHCEFVFWENKHLTK